MNQYLFSLHSDGASCQTDMAPEEMQQMFQRIQALESEMKSGGAWMFSARLTESDSATVVRDSNGETLMTDGPYAESKEYLAGFYIIQAADLDAALVWAGKVSACVGRPIEVRAFAGFQS